MTAHQAPTKSPSNLPNLLDIEQVAAHLNVNVRHLRRLVSERRIPFIKWGHLIRFDPEELRPWLEARTIKPNN